MTKDEILEEVNNLRVVDVWATVPNTFLYVKLKGEDNNEWMEAEEYIPNKGLIYKVEVFEPVSGDTIMVSDDLVKWEERLFITKDDNYYICIRKYKGKVTIKDQCIKTQRWRYAKPLN